MNTSNQSKRKPQQLLYEQGRRRRHHSSCQPQQYITPSTLITESLASRGTEFVLALLASGRRNFQRRRRHRPIPLQWSIVTRPSSEFSSVKWESISRKSVSGQPHKIIRLLQWKLLSARIPYEIKRYLRQFETPLIGTAVASTLGQSSFKGSTTSDDLY